MTNAENQLPDSELATRVQNSGPTEHTRLIACSVFYATLVCTAGVG